MYHYLKQHPEVFMPKRKEPNFFGRDMSAPYFVDDKKKYLALFEGARPGQRVGEASVWYLFSEKAAEEIKAFSPEADIFVLIRDPVDMIYSLHSQRVYNSSEDLTDFRAALKAEADRKKGARLPDNRVGPVEGFFYREAARYTAQIERYLAAFGRKRVHVIVFDDLKARPLEVYQHALQQLGVDDSFEPKMERKNPNKRLRSRTLKRFLRGEGLVSETFRKVARTLVPSHYRKQLRGKIKSINESVEPRPPMDNQLRERLMRDFDSEVKRLNRLLGRDLASEWGYVHKQV